MRIAKSVIERTVLLLILLCVVQLSIPVRSNAVEIGARIVLDSYEILDGQMIPGENVTLRLHFRNDSTDTSASGILITYSTGNSSIVPVYGNSNQIYINDLAAGETVTEDIECQILNYQTYTTAIMNLTVIYQDDISYDGSNSFLIAIPLEDVASIGLTNMLIPEFVQLHNQSIGHVNVENTSNQSVFGVILHCEGNLQDSQKTLEIGNLSAGDSTGLDLNLTFMETGSQPLVMWLEYQDGDGEIFYTDKVEYSVTVLSTEEYSYTAQNQDGSGRELPIVLVGIAGVGLVLLAARLLKRHNKYID